MARKKAIVIGVDGGTWTALTPYIKEGTMPNLGRIVEESAHGKLRSVIPPYTGVAWSSFATGVNPGRHGCFSFYTMRSFGDFRPVNSNDIQAETFYETLVRNGYKCTLINLPISYPPKIERTMVASLLNAGDDIVSPPELVDEIPLLKEYEVIPEELESPVQQAPKGGPRRQIELITENETLRFRVARELFGREWDFFFVLFSGCDWISHRAFAEMLSGEGPKAKGAREYFEKLDEWIGWFFENSGPDTLKIIISDHGFRMCKGNLSINSWLEQEGFLSYGLAGGTGAVGGGSDEGSALRAETLKPSVARLRNAIAGNRLASHALPLLRRVSKRSGMVHRMATGDFNIDLESSRVICPIEEGMYINDSYGEYEVTVDELTESLNRLNRRYKLFREVARREDIYWGPFVGLAPDINLVECDFVANRIRRKEAFLDKPISGHDKDGIWVLSGPEGVAGRQLNASLMDISPTVLDWMEVEPPSRPDGTSLLSRLELK